MISNKSRSRTTVFSVSSICKLPTTRSTPRCSLWRSPPTRRTGCARSSSASCCYMCCWCTCSSSGIMSRCWSSRMTCRRLTLPYRPPSTRLSLKIRPSFISCSTRPAGWLLIYTLWGVWLTLQARQPATPQWYMLTPSSGYCTSSVAC